MLEGELTIFASRTACQALQLGREVGIATLEGRDLGLELRDVRGVCALRGWCQLSQQALGGFTDRRNVDVCPKSRSRTVTTLTFGRVLRPVYELGG